MTAPISDPGPSCSAVLRRGFRFGVFGVPAGEQAQPVLAELADKIVADGGRPRRVNLRRIVVLPTNQA